VPTNTKPSIVFAHGIWADGSSFSKVIPTLQAEGYEVMAAQYGLDTLAGDVAAVKRTLGRVNNPAILVGHSYGGTVITAAGIDKRVAGLVYIGSASPGRGRNLAKSAGKVSHYRCLLTHRSCGWPDLDAPGWGEGLCRGSPGGGAEGCLGDPLRAGCRPVQAEG
jgi:pimeloyl-ACP methyl ester carboxylesterase